MSLTNPVSITLAPDLLLLAESSASLHEQTVNDLVNSALRSYLEQEEQWAVLLRDLRASGKAMGINSEEDVDRMVHEYRESKRA